MAGTINSLGIGSGVLTADVIDKLKANDVSNIITPMDRKITLNQQKGQALDLLKSLLTTFKANASSLADDTLYQKRTVSGNNDGVSVTALAGTAIQSFSIANVQLAKKDVVESGSFSSSTASVLKDPSLLPANFAGTLQLTIGSKNPLSTVIPTNFSISYTKNTTLEELKNSINDAAGTKVTASILQTGASAYNLVITSKETGEAQSISLTDTTGELAGQFTANILNPAAGLQTIQSAQDASFNYNGIPVTRSTNTINDLVDGVTKSVTINLLQNNAGSTISITQNKQIIADEVKSLSTAYNSLMKQLDDMTLADLENGKAGIFNGDNTIKGIKREITKMMTSINAQGHGLAQYGIGLDEKGVMSFTQADFDTQMNTDSTALEAFFSGATDTKGNYTEGIFGNLDTLLNSYTGTNGLMGTLTDASTHDLKSLNNNKTRSQVMLDARYATMSTRFAAYDSMISRLNNQFASLNQQIQAMANSKN